MIFRSNVVAFFLFINSTLFVQTNGSLRTRRLNGLTPTALDAVYARPRLQFDTKYMREDDQFYKKNGAADSYPRVTPGEKVDTDPSTMAVPATDPPTPGPTKPTTPDPDAKVWPPIFTQFTSLAETAPIFQPATTTEATAMGWSKVNQPCDPVLGEAWLFGGQRNIDSPMTIFFTPEVAGVAGVPSGLELDYYEYIEENLVGSYFSDERTAKDGTYHSVAVALRKDNVCDTSAPKALANEPYVAVAPYMANTIIPTTESAPKLSTNFIEGSCIVYLGFHWAHDVVGGANLTYEAKNLMPVMPMYSSNDGTINGIMFVANESKQVQDSNGDWKTNFWDKIQGLTEENQLASFCSNFCGTCQFSGSSDGYYATLHWFFKDIQSPTSKDLELCGKVGFGGPGVTPFECRNGVYPTLQ